MRKIVSILDGNDEVLDKSEQRKESTKDWQRRNATLIRSCACLVKKNPSRL